MDAATAPVGASTGALPLRDAIPGTRAPAGAHRVRNVPESSVSYSSLAVAFACCNYIRLGNREERRFECSYAVQSCRYSLTEQSPECCQLCRIARSGGQNDAVAPPTARRGRGRHGASPYHRDRGLRLRRLKDRP